MDRITKAILGSIAVALWILVVNSWVPITELGRKIALKGAEAQAPECPGVLDKTAVKGGKLIGSVLWGNQNVLSRGAEAVLIFEMSDNIALLRLDGMGLKSGGRNCLIYYLPK